MLKQLILATLIYSASFTLSQASKDSLEDTKQNSQEKILSSFASRISALDQEGRYLPLSQPETTISSTPIPHQKIWGITDDQLNELFEGDEGLFSVGFSSGIRFTRVSKGLVKLLGWKNNELITNIISSFWHPDDLKRAMSAIDALNKRNDILGTDVRFRCADGSYRLLRWTTLKSHFPEAPDSIFCIAEDITVQKEVIHDLYEQVREHNRLLKAFDDINNACFLNYEKSLSNKHYVNKIVAENVVEISKSSYGLFEEVFYNEAQQPFIEQQNNTLIFNKLEPQMSFEEQSHKAKNLIFCHTIIETLLKTKAPFMSQTLSFWKHSLQTSSDHSRTLPDVCYLLGLPILASSEKNNSLVGVLVLASYLHPYTNEAVNKLMPLVQKIAQVINEKKLIQWRQIAAVEKQERVKAEEASQAKSTFVSHMSHELRTPLNGIMGFLELALREETLTPDVQDYLNNAYTSTQALKAIANDILDLSKIETDAFKLEIIPFNPLMIAQEVGTSFKLEADKKNIQLKLEPSMSIPQVLLGDPLRFRQILFNLVGNSLKFTSQGQITIELKGHINPQDNTKFSFVGVVKDTGIGMTQEAVEKLFKPFMQADNSIMRKYGGTGLGLFITKQLCEKMEGNVKVTSTLGLGTAFTFTLNLGLHDQQEISSFTQLKPALQEYKPLPPIKILIAEDNLVNQKLLKAMLQKEACQLTLVNNGSEAVEMIENTTTIYDLILMDGEMPIMDGLTATKLIREFMPAEKLPIIGLTGHAMTPHQELFFNAGMNGYLTKPISKAALFNEILRCISSKDTKKESRERKNEESDENPHKVRRYY